jgi:hypothetical protein
MAACALVPFERLSKRGGAQKTRQGEKPATYDIIPSLLVTDNETFRRRGLLISREELCFWELVKRGMFWIIQRNLILEAPGEDRNRQANENETESTEARTNCVRENHATLSSTNIIV